MSLLVEVCKWWLREGHSSILIPVYHCVALHKDLLSWQLEFKENQQKEITVKCCSISASSLCYLVKPGSESCADQRFQIGFILPCYHSPCSTEQWVRKQLSPPPPPRHSWDSRSFDSPSPTKHPSIRFYWQIDLFPLSAWLFALFSPHRFRIKKQRKEINLNSLNSFFQT